MKGNIDFLADVFHNYKFNRNDQKYKSANLWQVLAVRREVDKELTCVGNRS